MNRMEEYQALLKELDRPVPALEGTLDRAKARWRRGRLLRPLASAAAVAACFVLLVNLCAPVAYACSKVPILRELAEAVQFNRSLSAAVEHDYVQTMDLEQQANGITARIEYLIVDQKQVNIFYRIQGEADGYRVTPDLEDAKGGCTYGGSASAKTGELTQISVVFVDRDVPDSLHLTLRIDGAEELDENDISVAAPVPAEEPEVPLAEFRFELTFEPTYITQGRTLAVEQGFTIDGQTFTLDQAELYPTNFRFHLTADPENTMWLVELDFYLELPDGTRLDSETNGISASGSTDSPMMDTYYAESSYFYDTDGLKIVITGAKLLDKEWERITVDLVKETAEPELPLGAELTGVERRGNRVILEFFKPMEYYALFSSCYWTPEGEETVVSGFSTYYYGEGDVHAPGAYETLIIEDYSYDQIILEPRFSRIWESGEPVELPIDLAP